jgi:feruloyl esterase
MGNASITRHSEWETARLPAGETVPMTPIHNQFDKRGLIESWVEKNEVPGKTLVVTAGGRSMPLCSYPNYPKYVGGPTESAESYTSATP